MDLKLSNAALGADLEDETGRSSVRLIYLGPKPSDESEDGEDGDEEPIGTVLCSLTPGRVSSFLGCPGTASRLTAAFARSNKPSSM